MENEYENKRPRKKRTRYYIDNEILEVYGSTLRPHGIAVYNVLAKHANSETQVCFPSYETIMKLAGIGRRNTLSKYLKMLRDIRLIRMWRQKDDRKNYYQLLDVNGYRSERATIRKSPPRIQNDGDGYPIKHIGSVLRDTVSQRMKSEKEITPSKEGLEQKRTYDPP